MFNERGENLDYRLALIGFRTTRPWWINGTCIFPVGDMIGILSEKENYPSSPNWSRMY